MPYHVWSHSSNFWGDTITKDQVMRHLTQYGVIGTGPFTLAHQNELGLSLFQASDDVDPVLRVPSFSLFWGWTDQVSRAHLINGFARTFSNKMVIRRHARDSGLLYGVRLSGDDNADVAACVTREVPPSGPWKARVPMGDDGQSLRFEDLMNQHG